MLRDTLKPILHCIVLCASSPWLFPHVRVPRAFRAVQRAGGVPPTPGGGHIPRPTHTQGAICQSVASTCPRDSAPLLASHSAYLPFLPPLDCCPSDLHPSPNQHCTPPGMGWVWEASHRPPAVPPPTLSSSASPSPAPL
eukprot:GGOE01024874.1.p3 GENE.GGOE01024874.1~~GGOE01024874.1.p3  ORF type:complete len:139 (+),score=3.83 GGOE01024874.1:1378-1794(+)